MTKTEVFRPVKVTGTAADQAVEAAVRRLTASGLSRKAALTLIDQTLYNVLGLLNGCGIGETSRFRQMNLSAGMKLNAIKVAEANAEDAARD
jgi:hypothetical protein